MSLVSSPRFLFIDSAFVQKKDFFFLESSGLWVFSLFSSPPLAFFAKSRDWGRKVRGHTGLPTWLLTGIFWSDKGLQQHILSRVFLRHLGGSLLGPWVWVMPLFQLARLTSFLRSLTDGGPWPSPALLLELKRTLSGCSLALSPSWARICKKLSSIPGPRTWSMGA